MKKKTDKKIGKFLLGLAIVSFLITLAEGIIYYNAEAYPISMLRWMLIIQNSIKAFGFKTDIGLSEIAEIIPASQNTVEIVIGYAYAVAVFTAPYCTLSFLYKIVEKFLRIKTWKIFHINKKGCIIFGYNDEVKALLSGQSKPKENYRIHLVTTNVSKDDEQELLNRGVILHKIDCLKLKEDQLEYFLKQMELKYAETIILFEESSAKNFSLYQMFREFKTENAKKLFPKKGIKFFCRCEDQGIHRILEGYHDDMLKAWEDEKSLKVEQGEKGLPENCVDIEVISIPELRIRNILEQKALHDYYLKKYANKAITMKDLDNWNLHLLIIGFGKLGQQLLLQAMNQGIVSKKNPILIDVIDADIDTKRSIFENNFDETWIRQNKDTKEEEIVISSDEADGTFRVRFHKMDIRYQQFYQQLQQYGDRKKDGIYTYIAICVEDEDVSLHCMSQVKRYLNNCGESEATKDVPIAIRMEYDKKMAKYLNEDKRTYENVVPIEDTESTISLTTLLHGDINQNAKKFNYIYNTINVELKKLNDRKITGDVKSEQECWNELALVRRNSNRALAYHQNIKTELLKKLLCVQKEKECKELLKIEIASLLNQEKKSWVYSCSEKEFADKLSATGLIGEFSKMEHRRWCYYMVSCGWKRTENPKDKKNDLKKENPCLCTWKELKENRPEMCKYDLMPLLLYCGENAQENGGN